MQNIKALNRLKNITLIKEIKILLNIKKSLNSLSYNFNQKIMKEGNFLNPLILIFHNIPARKFFIRSFNRIIIQSIVNSSSRDKPDLDKFFTAVI